MSIVMANEMERDSYAVAVGFGQNDLLLVLLFSHSDGHGRGVGVAMGNADLDFADAELLDDFLHAAAHGDYRSAAGIVADFHVAPGNTPPPTRADGLKDRFFCRPTPREMLRRLSAILAIGDFFRRIDAVDEKLPVPLNHPRDPQAFGDIGADSNNVGHNCGSMKYEG
jgi:hypothetical protein